MAVVLDYERLQALIYGATFFGAGGGGSISGGLALLNELGESVKVEMLEVGEMPSGTWSTMVAGLGSPIAMKDLNFGPLAVSAVEGMISIAKSLQKREVSCIYSGEQGGFNTMVPIYTAAKLGLPILDLDANGRAVPELNTGLNPVYDIPLPSLILSNQTGDITVGLPKNAQDNAACETLARTVSTAYGGVGFSAWLMNQSMHRTVSVLGQLSLSIEVGRIFLKKPVDSRDLIDRLRSVGVAPKVFTEGEITNIDVKVEDGFDYGKRRLRKLAANMYPGQEEHRAGQYDKDDCGLVHKKPPFHIVIASSGFNFCSSCCFCSFSCSSAWNLTVTLTKSTARSSHASASFRLSSAERMPGAAYCFRTA